MAEETKATSKRPIRFFIVLFILSLALNVFLFFRYAKSGMEMEAQNADLISLLEQTKFQKDSINDELNQVYLQLQEQLEATLNAQELNEQQKMEIEEQLVRLEQQKNQISRLIAQGGSADGGYATLSQAKTQIQELKQENESYIQQLEESIELYNLAQEAADNFSLTSMENLAARDSLDSLYTELNNSLGEARTMRIHDLNTIAMRDRKGNLEPTNRASRTSSLMISFRILESSLVELGSKTIDIRILGTAGEVLSDQVMQLTNSDEVYTMHYDTDYEGKNKDIILYYTQKAKYKPGKHTIELYHEGVLLDVRVFELY